MYFTFYHLYATYCFGTHEQNIWREGQKDTAEVQKVRWSETLGWHHEAHLLPPRLGGGPLTLHLMPRSVSQVLHNWYFQSIGEQLEEIFPILFVKTQWATTLCDNRLYRIDPALNEDCDNIVKIPSICGRILPVWWPKFDIIRSCRRVEYQTLGSRLGGFGHKLMVFVRDWMRLEPKLISYDIIRVFIQSWGQSP